MPSVPREGEFTSESAPLAEVGKPKQQPKGGDDLLVGASERKLVEILRQGPAMTDMLVQGEVSTHDGAPECVQLHFADLGRADHAMSQLAHLHHPAKLLHDLPIKSSFEGLIAFNLTSRELPKPAMLLVMRPLGDEDPSRQYDESRDHQDSGSWGGTLAGCPIGRVAHDDVGLLPRMWLGCKLLRGEASCRRTVQGIQADCHTAWPIWGFAVKAAHS